MKTVPRFPIEKQTNKQISISQLKENVTHKYLNPLREMFMIKNIKNDYKSAQKWVDINEKYNYLLMDGILLGILQLHKDLCVSDSQPQKNICVKFTC